MNPDLEPLPRDVTTLAAQITARIPGADVDLLLAHRFDLAAFLEFQRAVRAGQLTSSSSLYLDPIAPPRMGDIEHLPLPGTAAAIALRARGEAALAHGQVAVVVAAGGLATRFQQLSAGSLAPSEPVVKGTLEVLDGKSFLELKLEDARRAAHHAGGSLPFCVMGSFATLGGPHGLEQHLITRGLVDDDVILFSQSISLRLTPNGGIFGELRGQPLPREAYTAPGHGDLFRSLRATGVLHDLRARGVTTLLFSNVDNLGATVDATLIGYFVQRREDAGIAMLAESVARAASDAAKVGAVVRAGSPGALRILEGFRIPDDVDARALAEVSINSFVFDLQALDREIPLVTHAVLKAVGGRAVLQPETVTCEATSAVDVDGRPLLPFVPLHVQREGGPGRFFDGRFYPVKSPADLVRVRDLLRLSPRPNSRPAIGRMAALTSREAPVDRIARLQSAATTLRAGGVGEPLFFSAPGRINLIGEHTDYNEGFVLPAAIDRGIVAWARPRADDDVVLLSLEIGSPVSFAIRDAAVEQPYPEWSRYARAVVAAFAERGINVGGFEMVLTSDLTPNSGMSSSTALCVVVAAAIAALSSESLPLDDLARLAQRAEHLVGVDCGIMDQWVIVHGRARHAMLLDCRSLATEHVPLHLGPYVFLVADTGKRRALIDSGYNRRRAECTEAARRLAVLTRRSISSLRDVTALDLERYGAQLPTALLGRVAHVVDENARVLEAAHALRQGPTGLRTFGELLDASHFSLQHRFEVSCFELDTMVELVRRHEGVLGARMMGGGFGGCTLSLVHHDAVAAVVDDVDSAYRRATGLVPAFHVVSPEDGLREITDVAAVPL
ncbi:MAG: galactokinase [Deltaproteobacteria bacterium]|nr:galactokinase [Deltaproteobacteria bacterium]